MWRGGLGVEKGLCVSEFSREQRRDARGSFGTAERREVGYMTPHSCNCRDVCKCVSCLLGCVPVRREEGGLGEGRDLLVLVRTRVPPPSDARHRRQKLQGVGMH